jgi:gliding motility-associated-like protein
LLILHAGSGFRNYRWQNGSVDSIIAVTLPGIYYVMANDYCGNQYFDTIKVIRYPASVVNLGTDTSICINNPIVLNSGPGYRSFLWNTGDTMQQITVVDRGEYSVTATNANGCNATDTIKILNVYPSPLLALKQDQVLCLKQDNVLKAGAGFSSWLWQDGSTDSMFTVLFPGEYKVTVKNNFNCFATDSVRITKVAIPPSNFLPKDTTICSDDTILLTPLHRYNKYLWSSGSTTRMITIAAPANIWLQVIDSDGCKGLDTIKVSSTACADFVYIPTAFTPNGDGRNDVFKPTVSGRITKYKFSVYNRYGQQVYYSTDPGTGWNGKIKGMPQNLGSFVWVCSYQFVNKDPILKRGSVLLLR